MKHIMKAAKPRHSLNIFPVVLVLTVSFTNSAEVIQDSGTAIFKNEMVNSLEYGHRVYSR